MNLMQVSAIRIASLVKGKDCYASEHGRIEVLKRNKNGFGFVEDVFVPSWLIEGMENNETLKVKAVKSYDKKKDQWGWKAVKVIK